MLLLTLATVARRHRPSMAGWGAARRTTLAAKWGREAAAVCYRHTAAARSDMTQDAPTIQPRYVRKIQIQSTLPEHEGCEPRRMDSTGKRLNQGPQAESAAPREAHRHNSTVRLTENPYGWRNCEHMHNRQQHAQPCTIQIAVDATRKWPARERHPNGRHKRYGTMHIHALARPRKETRPQNLMRCPRSGRKRAVSNLCELTELCDQCPGCLATTRSRMNRHRPCL